MTIYNNSLNAARDLIDTARETLRGAQFAPEVRLPLAILDDVACAWPSTFDGDDLDDLWRRLDKDYAPQQMQQLASHLAFLGRTSDTVAANALALHAIVVGLGDMPPEVARNVLVELKPAFRIVGIGTGF